MFDDAPLRQIPAEMNETATARGRRARNKSSDARQAVLPAGAVCQDFKRPLASFAIKVIMKPGNTISAMSRLRVQMLPTMRNKSK